MCLYDEISVVTISRVMRRISSTYHRAFIAAKLNFTRALIIYFFQKAINLILSQSFFFSYLQLGFVSSKTRKTHRWLGTFFIFEELEKWKDFSFCRLLHTRKVSTLFGSPAIFNSSFRSTQEKGEGGEAEFKSPSQRERCSFSQVKFHFILFTYHSSAIQASTTRWMSSKTNGSNSPEKTFHFLHLFSSSSSSSPSEQA